jgi:glycosyltransferase involved in cell wall biosynthesis
MRIAQVACVPFDAAGGIATGVRLVEELLSGAHEVVNFTPGSVRPWLKYGHGAFLPQLLWRLPRFDYIYLHYPFFGTAEIVWLLKIFFPRQPKLIIHYHMDVKNLGLVAKIASGPSRLIRRSLLDKADIIVSASLDYVKASRIKKYYQAHPEKFREIPFGLDLEKFQPKIINRPTASPLLAQTKKIIHYVNDRFIKKNRLDLLFVGGLDRAHYFKGVTVMLRALFSLTAANWRLTIIGDGDRRRAYETLAAELGLEPKIEFAGHVSEADKIRAYQNADLLLLPSINSNEAFGLVLIEALACGVPVIASDLPGVRRVFTNYQEGLLTEPGSAADLKSKLEFIFNNEERRREMARAARRLAEAKYDWRLMGSRLKELLAL